ncbi:hypothetical protein Ssi03_68890 [Sphaerisporangium siamense]|uniref:Uncharacterized protein n=1 Tax=Sphaerisporangium siamense TaxID=795645 RepID=A0A7W7G9G2_9ACTN|nr:hypothetical protein [Sphaerisporangium siamense]MBB4700570.1 hypothetical protein [Sphaerisporangium siamense]GII88899.1 hypothetical protein Ssi03_68890 [Sphaerisporangium siamense]
MTGTGPNPDRLYELLPVYHRRRDAEAGGPLRALLAVVAEQIELVQAGVERMYENWFIETCEDWAVPYLGDLVGHRLPAGYAEALAAGEAARGLAARLAPRRAVAGTVADRRRKGTLPLLEELAMSAAGWPARAVEFSPLTAGTVPVRLWNASPAGRAPHALGFVDLREGARLDLLGSPFDDLAHTVAAPRITAARRQGRHAPPQVGLFVWRLKPYSITRAPAYCIDKARNLYTFSILGDDVPLVAKPVPEPSPAHLAAEENVPAFIRRRALRDRLADFYGPGKSFAVWRDDDPEPLPPDALVVADLARWAYRPRRGQVLVDPVRGRIAFHSGEAPKRGVWVSYHYASGDDLGGGEYPRTRVTPPEAKVYRVGPGGFAGINEAYTAWKRDNVEGGRPEAVIEIVGSGAHQERLEFALDPGDRLELRAAPGARPVLRMLDWHGNRPDSLQVTANPREDGDDRPPPRVVLDGLLVTGRGVTVSGPVGALVVRHSTLVPGWSLESGCGPAHPEEPSLILENTTACVQIERSVVGTILVIADEARADPLPIHLADSVLDATAPGLAALSAPDCRHANAVLHARRSTVIGEVHAHAVRVAENTLFDGRVSVARRAIGCLRFCHVPPGSRTPRRYHCEPDRTWAALREAAERGDVDPADLPALRAVEAQRVRPRFTARRYGAPGYVQLAADVADEIARGAEDGSEMGVWHDLYQPQRADGLRARLQEFSPAGFDAGILYAT